LAENSTSNFSDSAPCAFKQYYCRSETVYVRGPGKGTGKPETRSAVGGIHLKHVLFALSPGLVLGLALSAFGQTTISIDENGNGTINSSPLSFQIGADPGPGGLPNVLIYKLPFAGVPGQVELIETDKTPQIPGDVIRFNGDGTAIFYSSGGPGNIALADEPRPPAPMPNTVIVYETGSAGSDGASYTPTAGQPGYDASALPTYNFSSDSPSTPGLQFVPITPCRVVDTRNAAGPFGGPELSGDSVRSFTIPSGSCGIPSTAQAYSFNVTVVPNGTLGWLTIWPTGQAQPHVSTLNSDGRTKANAAIVPAGTGGAVSVFVTDPTQVILDINGYFVPAGTATALAFYPLTPCRVVDTRSGGPPFGAPSFAGGETRSFPMPSSSCNIPAAAQAYSLNVTAVTAGVVRYVTTWPTGQPQPGTSTLNATTGTVTANAAIVPAGTSGAISVFASDTTDLIIDINGYFAPPGSGGLSLYTLKPCRVLDTRLPSGSPPFNGTKVVNVVRSGCGAPPVAQAFVLNATVVPPGTMRWLTLWPDGQSQPNVSTLNAFDGAITSNMAIVPAPVGANPNGSIDAFVSDPSQLILDISSFFAP
jgi:hypothetical protein